MLYRSSSTVVHIGSDGTPTSLEVEEGVLQGDVASPTLFILALSKALDDLNENEAISFADDLALTAHIRTNRETDTFADKIANIVKALEAIGISQNIVKSTLIGTKADAVRQSLRIRHGMELTVKDHTDYLGGVISVSNFRPLNLSDLRLKYGQRLRYKIFTLLPMRLSTGLPCSLHLHLRLQHDKA